MFENTITKGRYHVVKDFNSSLTRIIFSGSKSECRTFMENHKMQYKDETATLPNTKAMNRRGYISN